MEKVYDNLDLDYQVVIIKKLLKARKNRKAQGCSLYIESELSHLNQSKEYYQELLLRMNGTRLNRFNRLTPAAKDKLLNQISLEVSQEDYIQYLNKEINRIETGISEYVKKLDKFIAKDDVCTHPLFIDIYYDDLYIKKYMGFEGVSFNHSYKQKTCAFCKETVYKLTDKEYEYGYNGSYLLIDSNNNLNLKAISLDLGNGKKTGGPTLKAPLSYLYGREIQNQTFIDEINKEFILYLWFKKACQKEPHIVADYFQEQFNEKMEQYQKMVIKTDRSRQLEARKRR